MLREFLAPQLHEFKRYNRSTCIQQDGATCHEKYDLPMVKEMFPKKMIFDFARSPELILCNFFL